MRGQIILSHGSDSGPDATKVSVLAAFAESLGWKTQRPDYRSDDEPGYAGQRQVGTGVHRVTMRAQRQRRRYAAVIGRQVSDRPVPQ